MSIERKINRKKAYKEWKENMKGTPKKLKTNFTDFWRQENQNSKG